MTGRVDGVWQTETYVVGEKATPVDGVLFLTSGRWATLYFVPGPDGPWGSAEAGEYRFDGRLTFLHRLVFQGGGGRPLQIDQQAAREEECGVSFDGDRLTIAFPSGNRLQLRRVAG